MSLETTVPQVLGLLESRFGQIDSDGAGTIQFDELLRGLCCKNFTKGEELKKCFDKVDTDKSGGLEFNEFFALLMVWSREATDGMKHFFPDSAQETLIQATLNGLMEVTNKYDSNKSLRLSRSELDNLVKEVFPSLVGVYEVALKENFPIEGQELSFRNIVFLIYAMLSKAHAGTIKGSYIKQGGGSSKAQELIAALQVLEADFKLVDIGGEGTVEYGELLEGSDWEGAGALRIDFAARLQKAFNQVDKDGSNCLDFFEFVAMAYQVSLGGSYTQMVKKTAGAGDVKRAFSFIATFINKIEGNEYTSTQLSELLTACGMSASEAASSFSRAAGSKTTINEIALFKIIYCYLLPTGAYHDSKYAPSRKVVERKVVEAETSAQPPHPQRVNPVEVSKFVVIKVLGQGGQGKVCLGTYNGTKVAGKTFLSPPGPAQMEEVNNELTFFRKLDHPYCHYLLGAKTSLDNGGILVLTESCDNGSVFDLYSKKHYTFKAATVWRMARQCADGFNHIHGMGYMHRDIKSLNVFLTANFTCQVADFGMCTNQERTTGMCGTGQWMAPEVGAEVFGTPRPYDRRCDVYSFAILLWEFFHTTVPYSEFPMDQMAIVREVSRPLVTGGGRLFRPPVNSAKVPASMRQIMESCWATRPEDRPTFAQVITSLDAIRAEVCA